MATDARNIALLNTSNAAFQGWCADVIAGLLAVGLTQSSDTGQINTGTVTAPGGSDTSQGYAIFEPNDGVATYYIKVEFGSGGAGALQPAIWITVGWATNGAGTFTGGQASERIRLEVGVNSSNSGIAVAPCGFCKSGSAIGFFFNRTAASSGTIQTIMLDRFRDASTGAALTTGVGLFVASQIDRISSTSLSGVRVGQQAIPASGGMPVVAAGNRLLSPAPFFTATWARGSNIGMFPLYPYDAGSLAPIIAGLTHSPTDLSTGTTISVTIYGASHDYIATAACGDGFASTGYSRIAMIWE